MSLTLETIWDVDDYQIIDILKKTRNTINENMTINRIRLAKAYLETSYLTPESKQIIQNPEFEELILKYGL